MPCQFIVIIQRSLIVRIHKFMFWRFFRFSFLFSDDNVIIFLESLSPMIRECFPSGMPFLHGQNWLVRPISNHSCNLVISFFFFCNTMTLLLAKITVFQNTWAIWCRDVVQAYVLARFWKIIWIHSILIEILSPFAFRFLFHQHAGRLYFVHFVWRVVFFHLLQELFSSQKQVSTQVGCVFFSAKDVSGFVSHFYFHNGNLFDLLRFWFTCFLISASFFSFSVKMAWERHFAKVWTLLILSFYAMSSKNSFFISSLQLFWLTKMVRMRLYLRLDWVSYPEKDDWECWKRANSTSRKWIYLGWCAWCYS